MLQAIGLGGGFWNKCSNAPLFTPAPQGIFDPSPQTTPEIANGLVGVHNNLNVWLIIYGSVFFAIALLMVPLRWRWVNIAAEDDYDFSPDVDELKPLRKWHLVMVFLLAAWSIAWVAYGGVLLFGDEGKRCKYSTIASGKSVYKSVLGFWILMIIGLPGTWYLIAETFFFNSQ
jgi:hypothetical protein